MFNFKQWLELQKEQSAAIVVIYQNKALILQRGSTAPWMPNYWNLPGGGVDEGESAEAAAKREALEEAGVAVSNVRPLDVFNHPEWDLHVFTAIANSPNVKLNFESSNFAWVAENEVGSYQFVPYVKRAVLLALKKHAY